MFEVTEADEVSRSIATKLGDRLQQMTYGDVEDLIHEAMVDESNQVRSNVAEALWEIR